MSEPLRVLSLGAGIQSSVVLLMSCKSILPKLDHAIFADTQWEPDEVYENLEWLTIEAGKHNIPVHRVTKGDLRQHTIEGFVRGSVDKKQRYASLPLYTRQPNGDKGMIRRQCTREYKIEPIERFIKREILGLRPYQRVERDCVEQWFGISADELKRVRASTTYWKTHQYPLIGIPKEMLPKAYTRQACIHWLQEHYPGRQFTRSACIGCPYHSNTEWRFIRDNVKYWNDAIEVDIKIRKAGGIKGDVFLHRDCVPLLKADLRTDEEKGQIEMGFREECLGYCGI